MKYLDIAPKLKPLYVSFKRIKIGEYLYSKDFQNFVISANWDKVWVECSKKSKIGKSIFGRPSVDMEENEEALAYFIDYAYKKWDTSLNEHYFGSVVLSILKEFIRWSPVQIEINEVSSHLKKLGVPISQLVDFTNSVRKILSQKPKQLPAQIYSTSDGFASDPQKVFIVHGHNRIILLEVSNLLSRIGLIPIILHEQVNNGQTIIEKFEQHSNVGSAIVLLTADDLGHGKLDEVLKKRARQNVILELGYFVGKLGRKRVIPLYEHEVELPSDFNGVLYEELDSAGNWKFKIVKELKAMGYDVDANKIL